MYLAAGWAAVEILLAVRERFGLPDSLDGPVLALFVAGFVACALLLATGRLTRHSPLFSAGRILAAATVGSAITLGVAYWLGSKNVPIAR